MISRETVRNWKGDIVWKDSKCWTPTTKVVIKEDDEPKNDRQDTPREESDSREDIYGT